MRIKCVFFFLPHEEPPVFCQELLYDPKYQWMVRGLHEGKISAFLKQQKNH